MVANLDVFGKYSLGLDVFNYSSNNTQLSVRNSLGAYIDNGSFLKMGKVPLFNNGFNILWNAQTLASDQKDLNFRYGISPTQSPIIFKLTSTGKAGIGLDNMAPQAKLHIKDFKDDANEGNAGKTQGLLIENNGFRDHDFAFEIRTGQRPAGAALNNGRVFTVSNGGTVHIGPRLNWTLPPYEGQVFNLYVQNGIRTEALRVDLAAATGWADFVLKPTYSLMPLAEVESFILENEHLPNVPSEDKLRKEGIDVSEMLATQMEKIEELTLYIIQMEKRIKELEDDAKL